MSFRTLDFESSASTIPPLGHIDKKRMEAGDYTQDGAPVNASDAAFQERGLSFLPPRSGGSAERQRGKGGVATFEKAPFPPRGRAYPPKAGGGKG